MASSDWQQVKSKFTAESINCRLHKLQEYRLMIRSQTSRLVELESLGFDAENCLDHYHMLLSVFDDIVNEMKLRSHPNDQSQKILLETSLNEVYIYMKTLLEKRKFNIFLQRNLIRSFGHGLKDKLAIFFKLMGQSGIAVYFEYDILKICTSLISQNVPNSDLVGLQSLLDNEIISGLKSTLIQDDLLLTRISQTLSRFLIKAFCRYHSKKLYDCLASSDQSGLQQLSSIKTEKELRNIIWVQFEKDLDSRLLHVGIATKTILAHLELGIAGISDIDPSRNLLENYLKRVKAYLLARRNDYPNDLLYMIEYFANGSLKNQFLNPVAKAKYDLPDLDPRNFDSCILADIRASTKSGNVFAILANFFESSAAFVNTYKKMIIRDSFVKHVPLEKIVKKFQYYCKNFEGEEWKECLVMIKDMYNSGQMVINASDNILHGLPLSYLFWPEHVEKDEMDSFYLPNNALLSCKVRFEDEYQATKSDRKLEWTNSIGYVSLDVQFDNTTLSVECTNDEASVLMVLSENPKFTFEKLLETTNFDSKRMQNALKLWLAKDIIKFDAHNQFCVVDIYNEQCSNEHCIDYELKTWSSGKIHSESERPKFKDIFEKVLPLITGMLRNMGALSVVKIQSSLGLFSSEYKEQEIDLKKFLDYKASIGDIQMQPDGSYSLKTDS